MQKRVTPKNAKSRFVLSSWFVLQLLRVDSFQVDRIHGNNNFPAGSLVVPRKSLISSSQSSVLRSATADIQINSKGDKADVPRVKPTLCLLTFDLDDTVYPLDRVIDEANAAFARAMELYGFSGIKPSDISRRSMQIRKEMDPEAAMVLTHTELRKRAIRSEMENVMLQRKLEETAEDWATNVDSLGKIVVENAKKYVIYDILHLVRSHCMDRQLTITFLSIIYLSFS
jgi:hypothetical protein